MTQVYSPYFLSKIRPTKELSRSQNNYLDQLERIIQQLYQRSGGEVDSVVEASEAIGPFFTSALQLSQIETLSITADFTTTDSQVLICNNSSAITITLNSTPSDLEKVTIKRRDALVTISGSIDGDTELVIGQYESPTLIYTIDGGEWSIV